MIQTYLILGEVFFAASNTHSPERKCVVRGPNGIFGVFCIGRKIPGGLR